MRQVPGTDDEDVSEIVDLIEHEPKVGGLFGISPKEHDEYMQRILQLIHKLETGG